MAFGPLLSKNKSMKTISITAKSLVLFLLAVSFAGIVSAQETKSKKQNAFKTMLIEKSFVFKAQSVSPTGGATRQLTSDYDLRVSNDTIQTYLPYFGRAYQAPMNPSEGGIHFTSTNFDYQVVDRKKGRTELTIRPIDAEDVREMTLSVSKNGYASLQVLSNNRQPISFNGVVTPIKRR